MITRALILAFVAAAAAVPTAGPVHVAHGRVGLQPRDDGTVDFAGLLRELNHTLMKYKADHTLHPLEHYLTAEALEADKLEKRAKKNLPLIDQSQATEDLLYYGKGQVGKKHPQTFTIDFDTGSADFFVPGPKCGKANGCHGTPYREGGVSEGKSTSITYGSGKVTGNDYFDKVCVAGLCAPHTNVISLTNAQGFSTSKSSSLMGMGFQAIAASKEPTFFENLIKLGKVTKNEFSFYLGRAKSGTGHKSQMTLGGVDRSKFHGKRKSHPVTKKGYWQIAIDGMAVKGKKEILTKGTGAIDTGTTVIIAPTLAAIGLFKSVKGSFPIPLLETGSATETAFAIPCDTKETISMVFGGVDYAINPLDLNLGKAGGGIIKGLPLLENTCVASIIASDLMPGEEFYVVGDTFLKNWYSTFNFDKGGSVSFAKSV